MSFLKKIEDDMKTAMKAKEAFRVGVLRLVKAAVKNKELEPPIHSLTEPEVIAILSSLVKQRRDSVEQYTKAGRADLAANEDSEIKIIQEYLPQALSESELASIIAAAILKSGANGPQDMGKVMKELKDQTAGRVDGKMLADQVKAALQKS
jgi:uncharacterized protein YqeY